MIEEWMVDRIEVFERDLTEEQLVEIRALYLGRLIAEPHEDQVVQTSIMIKTLPEASAGAMVEAILKQMIYMMRHRGGSDVDWTHVLLRVYAELVASRLRSEELQDSCYARILFAAAGAISEFESFC